MKRTNTLLWSLLAVGFSLGLGLFQSAIWNGPAAPGLARAAGALVPSIASLPGPVEQALAPPAVYFAFGRLCLAAYVLLGLAASGHPALGRPGRLALVALLAIAGLGDIGTYWVSESAGPAFRQVAFWRVEVPALVAALGFATLRGVAGVRRRDGAWPLALALPLAIVATVLLRYLPHAPLAGLALSLTLAARTPRPATSPLALGVGR